MSVYIVQAQATPTTITGRVMYNGAGAGGAIITASWSGGFASTIADSAGNYAIQSVPDSVEVVVSATYTNPHGTAHNYPSYTIASTPASGGTVSCPVFEYTAPVVQVSGTVTLNQGSLPSLATLKVDGTTISTDVSGPYSVSVPGDGSYTIRASWTDPYGVVHTATRALETHSSDVAGQDLDIAYVTGNVSGRISYRGAPLSGQTVVASWSGQSTASLTDASGVYTITGIPAGESVTISASYITDVGTVSSSAGPVSILAGKTATGIDINLRPVSSAIISGVVTCTGGVASEHIAGIHILVNGVDTTVTDGNGRYTVTYVGDSNVTMTASYGGHSGSRTARTRADGIPVNGDFTIACIQTTVEFTAVTSSVAEGGTTTLTLRRTGSVPSTFTVYVGVNTTSGYSSIPGMPGTITFGPNDIDLPITITVPSNTVAGDSRGVVFTLSGPTNNALLGSRTTNTLRIDDTNSNSVIQFSNPIATVSEGARTLITINRAGSDLSATSSVTLTASAFPSGVTANITFPCTLTWNIGDSAPKMFAVTADTNAVIESSRTVTFTLSNPSLCKLGGNNQVVLTITDANNVPTVTFDTPTISVDEGSAITITATRFGDLSRASSVMLTAAGASGYTTVPAPVMLSWAAGSATASFTVSVPSDTIIQGNRQVIFSMSSPGTGNPNTGADSNYIIGMLGSLALTIHDTNAPTTIGFTTSGTTISASGGDVIIAVHRYGGKNSQAGATVSISGGSAAQGTDYTTSPAMPWTISFAPGEIEKTFVVHVNGGSGSKSVSFQLSGLTGATGDENTAYTLNIQDINPGTGTTFQFDVQGTNALSGTVIVNVLRAGDVTGSNSVEVWLGGTSTAVPGTDYTISPSLPATLNFGPGERSKSLTVNVIGNNAVHTTLVLILSNPSGGATLGFQKSYTLSMGDPYAVITPTPSPSGWPSGSPTPFPGNNSTITPVPGHNTPTPTPVPTLIPSPTRNPNQTEATSPNWMWLLQIFLIPLAGISLYYYAFVKGK